MSPEDLSLKPPQAPGEKAPRKPTPQAWQAWAGVGLIYLGHLLYSGYSAEAILLLDLLAALLVGACLIHPVLRAELVRVRGLLLPAALYLIVLLVAAWTLTATPPGGPHPVWGYMELPGASTVDKSATTLEIVKLLGLACFFVIGLASGRNEARGRLSIQLMFWVGAAFGVWAVIGAASSLIYQTQPHRLEAHFLNPNIAGCVFASLFVLALSEGLRRLRLGAGRQPVKLIVAGGVLLVLLGVTLGTASRGAILAGMGGVLSVVLLQLATGRLRVSRALVIALATLAILAVTLALIGDHLIDRFSSTYEAAGVRGAIYKEHWRAFTSSPLFGYGLGSFDTINKTLLNRENFMALWDLGAALNVYLQWLEEGGLMGAIPMFACIAIIIGQSLWATLNYRGSVTMTATVIGASLVFVFHGVTDSALQAPSAAAYFAWLLGVQSGLIQQKVRL